MISHHQVLLRKIVNPNLWGGELGVHFEVRVSKIIPLCLKIVKIVPET